VAKTDPSKGAKGLSAFVVDGDTPGLSATEPFDMLAPHIIGAVTFKDCYVPVSRLLGTVGEGFRLAMASLDIYRASVGAAAVGLGQAALEESVSRALARKQFGQAIGEFQAIQFKIADMATQVEAARMMVYRAAKLRDMGMTPIAREASMAKLFATEVAARCVDEAVQIWGGLGVCKGVRVERLFRQARALRIYEGTSEIQRLIIGRAVLREARKAAGQ
jgi:acyl-CoA dehydrogenase